MAVVVHRIFKTILFLGLFFLVVRYIYDPLSFIPAWNQHYVLVVSESLGLDDIDLFEVLMGVTLCLVLTTAIYLILIKIYRFLPQPM